MPIDGAIFDCDGTLVDSMRMWFRVVSDLLARHGVTGEGEYLHQVESLNLGDECAALHERFGIGESGEALNGELHEMVRYEYSHTVRAFPGVADFLQTLVDAGIPRIVASSTSEPEVWVALGSVGLDGFFDRVVSTEEVRRGKDYPDVYLAARDYLGTPTSSTWVFEDAPFGVATSRAAGFPNVCLLNDHDGRDEDFLRAHSDVLVHGYDELSLDAMRRCEPRG